MMKILHFIILWAEFVISHTSYTSTFCNLHPNEVWVKGFFLMVPHEEHGNSIPPFDDGIIREQYYLNLQQHPCLHYYYTPLHGCTYDVHLSHLKNHGFSCSTLGSFDVGGISSNTWVKRDMIEEHYYYTHLHACTYDVHLSHLETHDFPCSFPSLFEVGGT